MSAEVTGRLDELVSRPEFRRHQVKITIIDQPPAASETDDWLMGLRQMARIMGLRQMARNGVRIARPADDSRESIYE